MKSVKKDESECTALMAMHKIVLNIYKYFTKVALISETHVKSI